MLQEWLGPVPVSRFLGEVLHHHAWAAPGAARRATALFHWGTLGRILRMEPPDILVVARGRLRDEPPPRSLAELRSLMDRGIGLHIKHGERSDAGLAALASSFASDLPCEVHIQLFVTPGGTYGFGWHYDAEDVFVAQTAGVKDYYFRRNTVDSRDPSAAGFDFSRFRDERSPLETARLIAGDCLYIPARWWHMALCLEDSLSISVGAFPRDAST